MYALYTPNFFLGVEAPKSTELLLSAKWLFLIMKKLYKHLVSLCHRIYLIIYPGNIYITVMLLHLNALSE